MSTETRYAPDQPFPSYAFLPGRDPHPTRSSAGHSYSTEAEPPADYFESDDWRSNADYLYGCDLYNHGYLWEAHEAWEGLWHQCKHDASQTEFLQGLIQCAAASLKVRMQQPRGLAKLSAFGLERLERVIASEGPLYMGLDVLDFVAAFREFAGSDPESPDERPRIALLT